MPKSAAATEGADVPEVSGVVTLIPNEKPAPDPPAAEPAPSPPVLAQLPSAASGMSLPSPNIIHWQVLKNEVTIKLAQYESGLTSLNLELDGVEQRYMADLDELTQRRDRRKADLAIQIEDIEVARSMANASIDVADAYIRARQKAQEQEQEQPQ